MMMRFKEYLNEIEITHGVGSLKNMGSDYEQIKTWVQNFAPKFFKSGVTIYRGTKSEGIFNTRTMYRPSLQNNYYNLWIDNHEDWRKFPKRSKSLICTFDVTNAKAYGEVHAVIPKDSTEIGICPAFDIWYSFDNMRALTMDDTMTGVTSMLKRLTGATPDDWEAFKKGCEAITKDTLPTDDLYDDYVLRDELHRYSTLFSVLRNEVFRPKGFRIVQAKDINPSYMNRGKDNELWMSGDIAVVTMDTLTRLEDELR